MHVGSKTLLQQNTSVLNQGCRLTQIELYNGCKAAEQCNQRQKTSNY